MCILWDLKLMNTDTGNARFRLSTTEDTAAALQALLTKIPDLPIELLELRGKLDIFVAKIRMGKKLPSYVPKDLSLDDIADSDLPPVSMFDSLMNSPDTSGDIRNKLFGFTIMNGRNPTTEECYEICGIPSDSPKPEGLSEG